MSNPPEITGELDLSHGARVAVPTPQSGVVVADRLTKTYGARDAVHELSFTVQRGEVYGLLGPNGAGKTTTLRMLLGLVRPTSGSVLVLDARPGTTASLRGVGSLVEEPALYPYLSGRDNLRVLARYTGSPRPRIDEVLDLVGLLPRAKDKVRTYSLGMRQRLGVAAALLKDPELLVLDEPTNGLDPQGMAQMRRLIQELGSGERTVVLSSHLLTEVEQVCDRVGVIREGQLVAQGSVDQLRGAQAVHIVADPVERARQVLTEHPDVDAVRVVAGTLVVDAPAAAAAELNSTLVAADIAVSHLTVQRRALEDVFLDMTSDNAAGGAPGGTSSDGSPGGTTDSGSPGKASRAASESS
jgi:ABC-type multidrug transport system ATPase subunit